jgi:pimeloyl-ACP methyl ester carboxylesterase
MTSKAIKPKDKYLNVNGLRLHYLDWGNSQLQPMLLLHGFMAHAHTWDDFALSFRTQFHIIALDQRGHGESQWAKEGAYSIYDHFSDIANFIEFLHLTDLILVGHSMGGRNGIVYTACNTDTVERLILVDVRPSSNPTAARALKNLLISLPLEAISLDAVVQEVRAIYPDLSRETCQLMANYGFKQISDGKFVPKYDMRMTEQTKRSGYDTEDLWFFIKKIVCPTLIVRGKESPFLSEKVAQKMCRLIPKAELKEISKSTHLPAQENPKAFYTVISDFLNH